MSYADLKLDLATERPLQPPSDLLGPYPPVFMWNELTCLTRLLALSDEMRANAAMALFLETPHRPQLLRHAWRMTYAHNPSFLYHRFNPEVKFAARELKARIFQMEAERRIWGDDPLRCLLIAANFPLRLELPKEVTIWRGLASPWEAGRIDLAWSLDRDTAAWFAMRRASLLRDSEPTVIRMTVPNTAILWRSGREPEAEVIPRLRHGAYTPDTVATGNEVRLWAQRLTSSRNDARSRDYPPKAGTIEYNEENWRT